VHLDIVKDFYLPANEQEFCFKRNIKIYIKNVLTFRFNHHHQGACYLSFAKVKVVKAIRINLIIYAATPPN
jgi:hypothetical protein